MAAEAPPGAAVQPAQPPVLPENVRRFLSGAVSGTVTASVLQPFDVIRTVQQGRHAAAASTVPGGAQPPPGIGPLATARALVAEGGLPTLWRGLGPTIARVFFGAGVYFTCIHAISDALRDATRQPTPATGSGSSSDGPPSPSYWLSDSARSFVAGASARTLAALLLSPVAVVKTRMEWAGGGSGGGGSAAGRLPYRSTVGGVLHIARSEGVPALYAGLLPTVVRDSPFSGVYFMLYSKLKEWGEAPPAVALLPSPAGRNFVAATAAGAAATLLTQPADVIRTRLQIGAVPGVSVWGTGTILVRGLRELAATQGVRALFVGGGARIAKRALSTAITWTLFEEAMRAR